jgi:uncharacterized membrane protein
MAKQKIHTIVRVRILEDYTMPNGRVLKAGKYGSFEAPTAKAMIKAKAAEEIVAVNSIADIMGKEPYIKIEKNAEKEAPAKVSFTSEKKTKEEKNFKPENKD